jgi:hypothetical protein
MRTSAVSGYQHTAYAEALSEFGRPRHLPACDGWILTRPIAGFPWRDARGCYPIFSCADWMALRRDLGGLDDIVSLVLVADPFGNHTPAELAACFPDLRLAYKEHYVIDLSRPLFEHLSDHHGRNVRKATGQVEVEQCKDPIRFAGEWIRLYGALIERHQIRGIAAFSKASFEKQMQVPGLTLFRAVARNETVGMMLWYRHNEVGYYHLAAYSELGYELKASFALFAWAIDYFSTRLRFLSLGAGAGIHGLEEDGLTRFKKGWATGTRTVYLCGRIFDRTRYNELVRARGVTDAGYFPLYRKGEVL